MAFYDNMDTQTIMPVETLAAKTTTWSNWLDVGANAKFCVELTVLNLSGPLTVLIDQNVNDQTHDWSIEHTANFADSSQEVTELFTAADFTQVIVSKFPNIQTAYFGIADSNNLAKNSKRYIRIKAALNGTAPVSTWTVKVVRVGGSVGTI